MPTKLETRVVGMQYRTKQSLRYMMEKSLPLRMRLEREPDNKFDRNAIRVIADQTPYKGMHIGYVPRKVAELMAPKMDQDKERKHPWVKRAKLLTLDALGGEGNLEIVVGGKIKLDD